MLPAVKCVSVARVPRHLEFCAQEYYNAEFKSMVANLGPEYHVATRWAIYPAPGLRLVFYARRDELTESEFNAIVCARWARLYERL